MTAMMAFFLVLWIVNSTSKETRSSVARYFNPIKLADTTPARKGLNDPKDSDFDAAATAPHAEAPKSKPEKNAPEHANEPSKADSKEKPAKDAQKVEPAKAADAKAQAIGQLRPPAATDAKLFEDP
jgi:chemotaxis protein MotB